MTEFPNARHLEWLYASLGALLCSGIAALLCIFLQSSSFKTALPICFLAVIAIVAVRFGTLAGTLGTLFAEGIYAVFLFEPFRSVAVQSQAGRNSLLWMFLGGLALSELLGNHPTKRDSRKTNFSGPPAVGPPAN